MAQNTDKKPPESTIHDRRLKAVIWGNPIGENDTVRYSVEFSAGYKTAEGNWKDTKSFYESELLRIARLAQLAFDKVAEIWQQAQAAEGQ